MPAWSDAGRGGPGERSSAGPLKGPTAPLSQLRDGNEDSLRTVGRKHRVSARTQNGVRLVRGRGALCSAGRQPRAPVSHTAATAPHPSHAGLRRPVRC